MTITFRKNDRVIVTCKWGGRFYNKHGIITYKVPGRSVVHFDDPIGRDRSFVDTVLLHESECATGHGPENTHIGQELPP